MLCACLLLFSDGVSVDRKLLKLSGVLFGTAISITVITSNTNMRSMRYVSQEVEGKGGCYNFSLQLPLSFILKLRCDELISTCGVKRLEALLPL